MNTSGLCMVRYTMDGLRLNRHEKERLQAGFRETRLRPEADPRLVIIQPKGAKVAVNSSRFEKDLADCWHHSFDISVVRSPEALIYLGEEEGNKREENPKRRNFFAIAAANVSRGALDGLKLVEVKGTLLGGLEAAPLALLGLALAATNGQAGQRFCPACGGATSGVKDIGFSRRCESCPRQYFPQVIPAVLVAVLDGAGHILLSQRRAKSNVLTILSGFILQGETAETAARREVEEEAGVRLDRLNYVGSQTWPFPSLLMLTYYAVIQKEDREKKLVVEADELVKVEWVEKTEVQRALGGLHPSIACPPFWTAGNRMIALWAKGIVNDQGEVVGNPQASL
ncbi:unnamed protein product [Phytomonas sp. Hart1]|nr:unnamed protein product [Phytomonas sp. Hart1]|eukprot:CCW69647.1 unnamed protein product [Phytomonas sp. isolate Hart1]